MYFYAHSLCVFCVCVCSSCKHTCHSLCILCRAAEVFQHFPFSTTHHARKLHISTLHFVPEGMCFFFFFYIYPSHTRPACDVATAPHIQPLHMEQDNRAAKESSRQFRRFDRRQNQWNAVRSNRIRIFTFFVLRLHDITQLDGSSTNHSVNILIGVSHARTSRRTRHRCGQVLDPFSGPTERP